MTTVTDEVNYHDLNAELNLYGPKGEIQFGKDKEATRQYFLQNVNQNTVFFHSLREKLDYLYTNEYYDKAVFNQYSFEDIKTVFKRAYEYKFRFQSFLGAYKFYTSYALKTFDGKRYLERYEDRVATTALYLAGGDTKQAESYVDEIITGRFQPATPTFNNAGKKQRGEMVSCFLMDTQDSMESIARNITNSLQLSKRGGGVALNLTNIRELGAPIKKVENQSSGVVPVMKMLEDAFSYANQLGSRQGAGAVYLNVHHPDILRFLDTKRENADEKIRIKTLSIGLVIPDITFRLAQKNEDMYLFSPYDVEREYGKPYSMINVSDEYYNMVENENIRKSKTSARKLFSTIAELQFESGYPYIMFEDTVNKASQVDGKVQMSNLCSEILQTSTPSTFKESGAYQKVGTDISCNLGSLNVARTMESPDFEKTIESSINALTAVSDLSNISSVPSIEKGNDQSHAIGLGQMNLAGYFGSKKMHYGDEESLDFTNIYFYTVLYYAIKASNKIAESRGEVFEGFETSKYASGEFFDQWIDNPQTPQTDKVKRIFRNSSASIPTRKDWEDLKMSVKEHGMYNKYLQAVPPTGSISYINHATASIHPITAKIEARKEGKVGRVYYPAPEMNSNNLEYFKDAYTIGAEKLIDVYSVATKYVDQGLSCTLFFKDSATTRDLNKSYIYAWKNGLKTLYYSRIQQTSIEGTDMELCVSCSL